MRNKIFCVFILIVLVLTGCTQIHKNLVEDNFQFIKAGMTTSQIKQKLGKPDRIIKKYSEIQKLMEEDSESSTDMWDEKYPNFYSNFYGSKKTERKANHLLDKRKEMLCYEYNYKYYKKHKNTYRWHIYFIDNKVVSMYFP